MIQKIECVILECDNCQEVFENDAGLSIFALESDAMDYATNSNGWHKTDEGKYYCPSCHEFNDNDELVINKKRFKPANG